MVFASSNQALGTEQSIIGTRVRYFSMSLANTSSLSLSTIYTQSAIVPIIIVLWRLNGIWTSEFRFVQHFHSSVRTGEIKNQVKRLPWIYWWHYTAAGELMMSYIWPCLTPRFRRPTTVRRHWNRTLSRGTSMFYVIIGIDIRITFHVRPSTDRTLTPLTLPSAASSATLFDLFSLVRHTDTIKYLPQWWVRYALYLYALIANSIDLIEHANHLPQIRYFNRMK